MGWAETPNNLFLIVLQINYTRDFDSIGVKNRYYGSSTLLIYFKSGLEVLGLNFKDKTVEKVFYSDRYETES